MDRILTSPSIATGASAISHTPRIALWPGTMIGLKLTTPYTPRFVMVNVPSLKSEAAAVPPRALATRSLISLDIRARLFVCASLITGATSPSSIAVAIPRLTVS